MTNRKHLPDFHEGQAHLVLEDYPNFRFLQFCKRCIHKLITKL